MAQKSSKAQNVDLELSIQSLCLAKGKLVITPDEFDALLDKAGTIPVAPDFSPSVNDIKTTVCTKFCDLTRQFAQARSFNARQSINDSRKRIVLFLLWLADSDEITTKTNEAIDAWLKENVMVRNVTVDDGIDVLTGEISENPTAEN